MSILFFYEKCCLFLVKLTSGKFEIPLRTVVLSLNLASLIFISVKKMEILIHDLQDYSEN